jgi:hypothetical protein
MKSRIYLREDGDGGLELTDSGDPCGQAYVREGEVRESLKAPLQDAFGKYPLACDGILAVPVSAYRKLVDFVNK